MYFAFIAAALAAATPAAPAPPAKQDAAASKSEEPGVANEALTKAVREYPITMTKVRSYAAAVKMLREAAAKDPMVAAPFQSRAPFTSVEASARKVEKSPAVKAILDYHHLEGRDFVLIPTVTLSCRAAMLAERSGQAVPAAEINAAGLALWRTEGPALERLVEAFMADVQHLDGR